MDFGCENWIIESELEGPHNERLKPGQVGSKASNLAIDFLESCRSAVDLNDGSAGVSQIPTGAAGLVC